MDKESEYKNLELKDETLELEEGKYIHKNNKIIYLNRQLVVLNRGIAIHSIIKDKLKVSKSPVLMPNFYDGNEQIKSDIFELDDFLIFTTKGVIDKEELSNLIKDEFKLVLMDAKTISKYLKSEASTRRISVENKDNTTRIKNFENVYDIYQLTRNKLYLLLDWNTGRIIETDIIFAYKAEIAYFGYPINSKLIPLRDFALEHGNREVKKKIENAHKEAKLIRNPPKPNFLQ